MNFQKKLIILIGIISIFLLLSSGCSSFITPDYDSYTVSYIKVTPAWASMKINTSKTFTVWAYDSEGYAIPVDPSKVYWSCSYQCPACGPVWQLNPTSGSITTSFTPKKEFGTYYIKATYKGKTDDSRIKVY